ncbi:MAG: threonylcarbamoyl-AMP synthase [Phycisphaerales bacterium]|nr:MAG: threonylcarbamoyl-AMP synthase [Phycisphaerales bacterium]
MNHPQPELDDAVRRLRSGRLVAFPTETVYGLGALALNGEAVARVFAAKGRPASNPLIVHVLDEAMARRVTGAWPMAARRLASAFWPGPLTLVLPAGAGVPSAVTAGGPGVAVRSPDHPLALALFRAVGEPLVGPSANRSGAVSPTLASHVREAFDPGEVLVLDGGACRVGLESTVLSLMDPARPVILRPGMIGAAAIAEVLGIAVGEGEGTDGHAGSPGRLGPHYRPSAPVHLVETLSALDEAMVSSTGACVVLTPPGLPVAVEPPHEAIVMPSDASAYAARLYAALREADAAQPTWILVCRPPASGQRPEETAIWQAVHERLTRASTP